MKGIKWRPLGLAFFCIATFMVFSGSSPLERVEADASAPNLHFFPVAGRPGASVGPPLPVPEIFSASPPLNLTAIENQLQNNGLELGLNKMGFHIGAGGNREGLDEWMTEQDADGIPFFLKSADDAGPIFQAQELRRASGVEHTLVFRRTGTLFDVPNYNLAPNQAAAEHWARHMAAWPPELDPALVWIETINEVDKNRSEWLAEFAIETAHLALNDGFRWAAFGWSSGEPEPAHWRGPKMRQFLQLASQHPNDLAVALHEYSYEASDIGNAYPYLVGRFQELFQIADDYGIERPTVMITEWGWEYQTIPLPADALSDIQWAAWLYAAYPQVKGAAIWYLGPGFGGISNQTQLLIAPMSDYARGNYFGVTPGIGVITPELFPPPQPHAAWSHWPTSIDNHNASSR